MPEISVIIPMYKTPKLSLRRCLESLMAQTYKDFEVLVIDDGNEPGYEYIKDEYEHADSRITFVRQEHSGVSNARNLGLNLSKGKYISFVDSDDYVDQSFLEEMHAAMQDADVAICAVSEQYHPVYPGWTDCRVFWSKPSFYNGVQYINFCHNKMYRAEIIKNNNIHFQTGIKLGEDAFFLADYFSHCKSICKVREPRYHYVWEESSAMRRYRKEFWMWEKQLIERQWEMFHLYPLSRFEEQAMEHWLFSKLKYAFQYYLEREKQRDEQCKILNEICESALFARLMDCNLKGHKHFCKNDRLTIRCWKMFGITGVYLIHYAIKVRNRLRR